MTMRLFAAALLLLLLPTQAFAWGQSGHRLVAELAAQALTPAARADVARLLAGEPEPTLAGVSTWADEVRDSPEYRWTTPLHWVNFPAGQCRYAASKVCQDGLCVVAAIERYRQQLADRTQPLAQRRIALKFLVHFVGDVHQPLHAGYAADRGGNQFQISYLREGWNLHSVWDSLLIDSLKLSVPEYLARLQALPLPAADPHSTPASWAEESCGVVQQADFYPPKHKITGRYLEQKRPLADQRLRLAGRRLAALLNATLGAAP